MKNNSNVTLKDLAKALNISVVTVSRALNDKDGASYFKVFFKIILPLLLPAISTVTILKFVAIYNEYYIPSLYMSRSELVMISTALDNFRGPFGNQWEIICAGQIITMIPILIIFLGLQKYIYSGLVSGSVKE